MIIDEIDYIEKPETDFPFGNVCKQCAFYGTSCYNRDDFTCHSDARPDGIGIVFILADNQALEPTTKAGDLRKS